MESSDSGAATMKPPKVNEFLESLDPHLDFTDWIVLLQIEKLTLG